jgi:hypothetical protein
VPSRAGHTWQEVAAISRDREDLDRQLHEWRTEGNTVRPSRATGVPPAL